MPFHSNELTPVLDDLALLALVVAHGTDADLDPRETDALARGLEAISLEFAGAPLSGAELGSLFDRAVGTYRSMSVTDLDEVVSRLAVALDLDQRRRILLTLNRVAGADGVVHTMERTVIGHIAQSWGV